MKITRERLVEICRTFVQVLDIANVSDLKSLEDLAGRTFPIAGKENEFLAVEWRPSTYGTRAIDASYIIQHQEGKIEEGIPLNLKVNPSAGYSMIILKAAENIEGYSQFDLDFFGNIIQSQTNRTTVLKEILDKIRKIR
ncbi:MAG: hypothetical protein ABH840_02155 [Nanoarchaeota archaeon]